MLNLSHAPTRLLVQTTRHIERTIGRSPMVFHEMLGERRLDLHVIPPHAGPATATHPHGRNFFTIVTSGLSAATSNKAHAGQRPQSAELMISLPPSWPALRADGTFCDEFMRDERSSWPLRLLKNAARMCLDRGTMAGELFPCVTESRCKIGSAPFSGAAALPSALHPLSRRLVAHDDFAISFFALWPLYERELTAVLSGTQLGHVLAQHGVTDLIEVERRSML